MGRERVDYELDRDHNNSSSTSVISTLKSGGRTGWEEETRRLGVWVNQVMKRERPLDDPGGVSTDTCPRATR